MRQMLLLSNSSSFGKGFLEHCKDEIGEFLENTSEILFIPYAKSDYEVYEERVSSFFNGLGIKLLPIYKQDPVEAVKSSQAIYVPGGNTFRLLNELYNQGILELVRSKVSLGTKYIGSSAGSAIACPTIRTTNDMPIVEPPSLNALALVPFQLNCHYLDKDPNFPHNGESREMRIKEFHEVADTPVIGLKEDTWLACNDDEILLKGEDSAVLFRKGEDRQEIAPNNKIKI